MTKELRKKFILINMALVGTVLLIVFAVLCFQNYQRLEQDSMRVMERYFNDNGARPVPELEFDKKREWRNFPLMLSFCAVVDSNGELVSYQSDNLTVSEATVSQAVEAALDKMESSGKNSGTLSRLDLRYLARGQQGQMWIAFVDRTQEYASMRSFLTSALQLGAAGLIALFLISFFLSAWVVRPVERSWVQQRQFVADASHELKTPLTVILANTGILLSHPDETIAQQQRWVRNTQEEAVNMKKLVDEMLYLARTDATQQMVYSLVNLSDLVWSSVLPFESVAFEQGLELESDIAESISLQADEGRLRELLRILLDNACKYCAPKGSIFVRLEWGKEQEKAILSVRNTLTEKLPPEELERLFERFYRMDKARNREKGGYGLGLAIAKSIVEKHHGKIAASQTEEDIQFTVTLPVKEHRQKKKALPVGKYKGILPGSGKE